MIVRRPWFGLGLAPLKICSLLIFSRVILISEAVVWNIRIDKLRWEILRSTDVVGNVVCCRQ